MVAAAGSGEIPRWAAAALCRGQPNTYGGERPLVWGLAEQVQNFAGRLRHHRLDQQCRDADYLAGDVERGAEPGLIGFGLALAQYPRLLHRKVLVRVAEHQPDRLQRQVHRLCVEVTAHSLQQAIGGRKQRGVGVGELTRVGHPAVQVFGHHRQRALGQVAELVGQIGVDPSDDGLVAVTAVLAERDLPQQEVADLVHPERFRQGNRVDDVAHRFTHLLAAVVQEPVREDPSRQLDSG